MKISDIKVPKNRTRKALGDIDALAASMSDVGLLQPIVLDSEGLLIAGVRRLAAAKQLGWTDVKTTTVKNLDDALQRLKAERDENTCRLNFTLEEAVGMAERIKPLEDVAAKKRQQKHGGTAPGKHSRKIYGSDDGEAAVKTAAAVGMSRLTLARATEVVQAARAEPEKYQTALDLMNKTGAAVGIKQ